LRLVAQATALADPGATPGGDVYQAVIGSDWGHRWRWQVAAGLAAALGALVIERSVAPAVLLGVVVGATVPLTGHALEYPPGAGFGWLIQTLHVTGAGLWLGTLAALALMLPVHLEGLAPEARRGRLLFVGVKFSRLALSCAAVVVVAGALLAIADIGSWASLVGSAYGRTLLIKLAAVGAVLALGAWNWRRAVPRLAERELALSAGAEIAVTFVVLALTALLSGTEAPGL
jgi:putative copper export protein